MLGNPLKWVAQQRSLPEPFSLLCRGSIFPFLSNNFKKDGIDSLTMLGNPPKGVAQQRSVPDSLLLLGFDIYCLEFSCPGFFSRQSPRKGPKWVAQQRSVPEPFSLLRRGSIFPFLRPYEQAQGLRNEKTLHTFV